MRGPFATSQSKDQLLHASERTIYYILVKESTVSHLWNALFWHLSERSYSDISVKGPIVTPWWKVLFWHKWEAHLLHPSERTNSYTLVNGLILTSQWKALLTCQWNRGNFLRRLSVIILPGFFLIWTFGSNRTDVWPNGLLFNPVTLFIDSKALRGSLYAPGAGVTFLSGVNLWKNHHSYTVINMQIKQRQLVEWSNFCFMPLSTIFRYIVETVFSCRVSSNIWSTISFKLQGWAHFSIS